MTVLVCSITVMIEETPYSLSKLCELVSLPKRTVRYYIQIGLLEPPSGVSRGARYHRGHIERLLEIRKWQDAGLSLDRIRELLTNDSSDKPVPPLKPRQAGSVEVWSHIHIDDGIELTLEPGRAGLTPEQVREFSIHVIELYQRILLGDKK
jgi:DNA-binding transcriptional MerR regulator